MYDIERLTSLIRLIEKYFGELVQVNLTKDNSEEITRTYAVSLIIFNILNKSIDIAGEIITKKDFGMPSSYAEYFKILADKGIIKKELGDEMSLLIKDRNIIAHGYEDLTPKKVLDIQKRVFFVKDFIIAVKKEAGKNG